MLLGSLKGRGVMVFTEHDDQLIAQGLAQFEAQVQGAEVVAHQASWLPAICITLTSPSNSPSSATVISAEMLRNSRVRNFIASFIGGSQVVLLAFAVQGRSVDAQGFRRLIQRAGSGQDGADVGFFQFIQAQRRADAWRIIDGVSAIPRWRSRPAPAGR
jgi:hypothetical protein